MECAENLEPRRSKIKTPTSFLIVLTEVERRLKGMLPALLAVAVAVAMGVVALSDETPPEQSSAVALCSQD